ncbi:hypothetical protein Pmar_PMAR005210 [Perkinsus marinus ATCC 50983]|uniref:Uncharacterized protein n=1 Tax=Perkinsus marinus (strain ATCC 50983 / TXsc) TaxID=423536 RepID=C5KAX8_PERM5|nr:hypothetical protein Pmar_PMAR005210 [Perkinsus marinus ATCC 50983]EER18304.1 hypothetical protein Pmar_PMAR005210 [Perkinsus marinus ATCC 50983]|eukprot:XP_002786508.1 hypothetical protein Pmar_PMAR005210 [Perkinsus marinus ATCC 50983]
MPASSTKTGSAGIEDIQRTLLGIFNYYASPSSHPGERLLRASKLRRMCLDSGIIDEEHKGNGLTDVRVDLIYTRIHSSGDQAVPGLNKYQFMDAVVAVAEEKYQTGNPAVSLARLYSEHLSSFDMEGIVEDPKAAAVGIVEQSEGSGEKREVDEEVVRVFDACRRPLIRLYSGYFPMELHGEDPEKDKSAAATHALHGYSQKQLCQVFIDFELCPVILPKSQIFQVFRSVMKDERIAERAARRSSLGGRYFTYTHFEAALLRTAGVLFTDLDVVTGAPASTQTDAARLVRLLDRMDQSKICRTPDGSESIVEAIKTAAGEPRGSCVEFATTAATCAEFHRFLRDAGLMKATNAEAPANGSQLLTSVAADLIFLRSTERAKNRSSAKHRHYLDRDGFQRALVRVARAFYGHHGRLGLTDAEILRKITVEKIRPLLEVLGSPGGADGELVHECLSDLQDPHSGLSKTLTHLHPGIRTLFNHYAEVEGMSLEGFMRFCKEFEISSNSRDDVRGCSRLPLQRIFYDASHEVGHPAHHDGSKATSLPMSHKEQYSSVLTLSPEAFTLAFIMLSRKLMSQSLSIAEGLQRFAARLNHTSITMAVTSSGGGSGVNPQFSIDQLLCERNVLASLIYKMNNAHGRLPYFGALRKLQRNLDALLDTAGSSDSNNISAWSAVLARAEADNAADGSGQYARTVIASLEGLAKDAFAAAAPMRELLSRGHWLPFGLTVVGCTARIVMIAENLVIALQPYARAVKRSPQMNSSCFDESMVVDEEEDMGVAVKANDATSSLYVHPVNAVLFNQRAPR